MPDLCFDEIRDLVGDEFLQDKDIQNVIKEVRSRQKIRAAEATMKSSEQVLGEITAEMIAQAKVAAIIEKRNKAINILVDKGLDEFAAKFDSPADASQAKTVGTYNSRGSVDQKYKAYSANYLGGLVHDLREQGLMEILSKGMLDREISMELFELNRENGSPGLSKSREAQAIAEIIRKYQKLSVRDLNSRGAWIDELDTFIVNQSHDPDRLRHAGETSGQKVRGLFGGPSPEARRNAAYSAWRDAIMPLLDQERTFKDVATEDIERFMRGSYDALVTGMHLKPAERLAEDAKTTGFKGIANLARKISEGRVLFFQDGESWFKYNQQFGRRSLMESVKGGLDVAARQVALMENFGTNPRNTYDRWMERLKTEHRGDFEAHKDLSAKKLNDFWKEVDGSLMHAENHLAAKVGAIFRGGQNLARLGGLLLSQPNDIVNMSRELSRNGIHPLQGYAEGLNNLFAGRRSGEQRLLADLLGTGIDGMVGDIASRISATDNTPATLRKTQNRFFQLTGGEWWTDSHKTGAGLMLSRNLAINKNAEFQALDRELQRMLGAYGIDAGKWDIMRRYVQALDDGREYLSPDALRAVTDDEIRAYKLAQGTPSEKISGLGQFRRDLETSLRSYFVDRTDYAILTPGAREAAFVHRGTAPGTLEGELLRFIGQFKMFPITMITKGVGSELFGHGAKSITEALFKGKADYLGLAHLMVGTTLLGYASLWAKDIVRGKTPRDPTDWKTLVAAFTQGGGAGIYGDFLFGEFNRFGRSALSSLAGPALGNVDDIMELYTRWKAGDDFAPQAFRFALNNAPFVNLFYVRGALNYLFLYGLQEQMSPGYLRRMERRMEHDNHQTFFLPPSRYAIGTR